MPRSFRQALQAFRLIDFDIYPDAGNLQLPDAAVRVIEIVRQCKGGGGGGAGNIARWRYYRLSGWIIGGTASDGNRSSITRLRLCLRKQHSPAPGLIGLRTAEGRRNDSRILAAVDIALFCHAAAHHYDLIHRSGGRKQGILRAVDVILGRHSRRGHRHGEHQRHPGDYQQSLHSSCAPFVSSQNRFRPHRQPGRPGRELS